jgi:hypothetical protein
LNYHSSGRKPRNEFQPTDNQASFSQSIKIAILVLFLFFSLGYFVFCAVTYSTSVYTSSTLNLILFVLVGLSIIVALRLIAEFNDGSIGEASRTLSMMLRVVTLIVFAAILLVAGFHGLFANFQKLDASAAFLSGKANWLFFAIQVPAPVSDFVDWMTRRSVQSPFIPGAVTLLGLGAAALAIKRD